MFPSSFPRSGAGVIILSNASNDYLLQPGERASVDYILATTVPLHIQIDIDALYEITIMGGSYATGTSDTSIVIKPNNSDYAGVFFRVVKLTGNSGGSVLSYQATENNFLIGNGIILSARGLFSTKTACKTMLIETNVHQTSGGGRTIQKYSTSWEDVVSWYSLGTIVFGTAQTGRVLITRII